MTVLKASDLWSNFSRGFHIFQVDKENAERNGDHHPLCNIGMDIFKKIPGMDSGISQPHNPQNIHDLYHDKARCNAYEFFLPRSGKGDDCYRMGYFFKSNRQTGGDYRIIKRKSCEELVCPYHLPTISPRRPKKGHM